jgi:rod shape determining protein RodA
LITINDAQLTRVERGAREPWFHVDWSIVLIATGLAAFGLLNIYAARRQNFLLAGEDPYTYVKRQTIALGVGLAAAIVAALIDYRKLRALTGVAYVGILGLLGAVLVWGELNKGARAWFDLGVFQLQPAEFGKVVLIVVLAWVGAAGGGDLSARRLITSIGLTVVPVGLVLLQPDLGTALVIGAIFTGALLVAGARLWHIVLVTVLALGAAVYAFNTSYIKEYQRARLTQFIEVTVQSSAPEELPEPATELEKKAAEEREKVRANVTGSLRAIQAGGFTGSGLFEGDLTNGGEVAEQRTDFIFSVVGEQFGFVGTAGLISVYGLLGLRIWRVAAIARDLLGTLICAGALSMMAFHVFENIGMSMGIMPVTGIPLPLVSYGGSSSIAFLILLGLVENVHMHRFKS